MESRMAERALAIAREAHAGQTDKAGRPYIEHVERVVAAFDTDVHRTVAALHDVVEDCPGWTFDRLYAVEKFPWRVLVAVDTITKRKGERVESYLGRVLADSIAHRVKLADITDNADPERLAALPPDVAERLRLKYAHALAFLQTRPS